MGLSDIRRAGSFFCMEVELFFWGGIKEINEFKELNEFKERMSAPSLNSLNSLTSLTAALSPRPPSELFSEDYCLTRFFLLSLH